MYRLTTLTMICISILYSVAIPACAESLWVDSKSAQALADKRAAKVGDVVTVIIDESSSSSQQAATDVKKDSKTTTGSGVGPYLSKIPVFNYSGGDSMKGSGSTSRTAKFTARMTAVVKKVNDNGTMDIEGVRLVQTNKEKEEIKLTGTIRKQDVAPDNTIQSTAIANAVITHQGSGPIGGRQKEGIIQRILRILF